MNLLALVEHFDHCLEAGFYDDPTSWHSLDIDYETPRVERLWRELKTGHRGYIHVIHKAGAHQQLPDGLYHPHPWPSAVKVLLGDYHMRVGYGGGTTPPPVAVHLTLRAKSSYVMDNPDAWHAVEPVNDGCLTAMVTGEPWERTMPANSVPKKKLQSLSPERVAEILEMVKLSRQL